ncbi:aldo/keto reductase [Rhodococcus erythropolis]|uniref:aldo/keto reductase n=1 Tax=Rhodococcus erythropolis TaxID=1833 RepID=UPI0008787E1F|nr:aldo/keto reductase [Rhodococcus erythropolis]OFV73856.1 putative oxidoreductase [Rhodococcus erythropolis]
MIDASPTVVLADGRLMPAIGLGVWQMTDEVASGSASAAIAAGYRLIDTASMYANEQGVGAAIRKSEIPRGELFVTTKVWNSDHGYDATIAACRRSLANLGLEYIDLYLIHWALAREGKYVDTFRALLALRAEGLIRSVGVSNFTTVHLTELLNNTGEMPVVNQIELHPRMAQRQMRDFHAKYGIVTQAWSPLGHGTALEANEILRLAAKHCRAPAQIVLRWHLQNGVTALPKSSNPERIAANLQIFDFELDSSDMGAIDALDIGERIGADPDIMW